MYRPGVNFSKDFALFAKLTSTCTLLALAKRGGLLVEGGPNIKYGIRDLGKAMVILCIHVHCHADSSILLSQPPNPMIVNQQLCLATETYQTLRNLLRCYLQAVKLRM
ncbi:hypothetical protein Rhopal_001990-T1 [Rhodotorula paludigena]|uniref:Uncharacterized protein n=1 Tax=Rhodotorula paludigena TaxID=86838 RepID=A0AAV5GET6_9BASI|nr:hypothetical protein Rhopal_001990-T1 [Rhodotorula paludigena]